MYTHVKWKLTQERFLMASRAAHKWFSCQLPQFHVVDVTALTSSYSFGTLPPHPAHSMPLVLRPGPIAFSRSSAV